VSDTHDLSPRAFQIARAYTADDTYHVSVNEALHRAFFRAHHLATVYPSFALSSKLKLSARLRGDAIASRGHTDVGVILSELALSLKNATNREKALSKVCETTAAHLAMPCIHRDALEPFGAEFGVLLDNTTDAKFPSSFKLRIPDAFQFWLKV
jgi:hypothetical protein